MTDFLAGQEPTAAEFNDRFPRDVLKLADESVISTTTLQNDDELFQTVAASTKYWFELWAIINSGTTPDWKLGWSVPAGATMAWSAEEGSPASLAASMQGPFTAASVPPINGTGADQIIIAKGVITTTTGGTMRLQWAQNTSNATNTFVKANSLLTLRKIG